MVKVSKVCIVLFCLGMFFLILSGETYARRARNDKNVLEQKEFRNDELYISQTNISLAQIIDKLSNRTEWHTFTTAHKEGYVYIDPRSGRPSSITMVVPLIPGTGDGNTVTLESLASSLGYPVKDINEKVVEEVVTNFLRQHAALLNIDMNEIEHMRITHVTDFLWQVYITRQVNGIAVRDANMIMTINHGNLVLWGLEKWGDVAINLVPSISQDSAIHTAMMFIGGQLATDRFTVTPRLEIIPVSSTKGGLLAEGYAHRLAWSFAFAREGFINNWEFLVDAHTAQVLSMRDLNLYATRKIVGATYAKTNDDCCPQGCPVDGAAMSFTNTGFLAPNNYTSLTGWYDYTSGSASTTLDGDFVKVVDNCGTINESSATGNIDLGGLVNQHNCTIPTGHSPGDTFSSRTAAAEVAQINRITRSWINNSWCDNTQMTSNMNINSTCNAYYSGTTINFFRSGGGCRNTGEEVASIDHEWAHGLDDNDANGSFSNPEEVYADLFSIIKLHAYCPDPGWWWTANQGCGAWTCPTNPSSTAFYCDGYGDCCLSCTGLRSLDWADHASGVPHTPINFNCVHCSSGSGPCGRETHCENAPGAEAGWDLAARDLQAAPFNYDSQTAFITTTKLYIQGSGNITTWHSCNCTNGTSDGCASSSGYMQWLAADDEDGNVNNGTPHMTAIYGAFNRHAIACETPTPQNSGCTTPDTAPVLTATPGNNTVALSWTAVPNAVSYYVFEGTGTWACDMEKVRIATVTGTTYTDDQALNGHSHSYAVQAVGSNSNCFGPASNCATAVPVPCTSCAAYLYGSAAVETVTGGDGDAFMDNCESATIGVTIKNIGTATAQNTNVTITAASPFLSITTPMPINVGDIPVGGTVNTTFNVTIGAGATKATCKQTGTYNISVQSTGQDPAAEDSFGLQHEIDITLGTVSWPFETGLDGWTISQGKWELSTAKYNPGGSTASLHSSEGIDLACDVILSPEIEPTAASQLTLYNWYNIEHLNNSYWWDRAQIHAVNSTTSDRTLLTPTLGKLFKTGPWYDYPEYCDAIGTTPGWAGQATTPDRTWMASGGFNLSNLAGEKLRLELRMFTDESSSYENIYIDDMSLTNAKHEGCDVLIDSCTPAPLLQPYNNAKPVVNDGGNSIIEPDENAELVGTLENDGTAAASSVTGTLTTSDATVTITDANASYPNIAMGDHQSCMNCYAVTAPLANRPGLHWDFAVTENASATGYGPESFDYTYHVGESFSDVPTTNLFYGLIEALLHSGVTSGCTATQYCPSSNVMREAMAKFICFAMNSSNYGACLTTSCGQLFGDVPSSNPFCSSIEALYNLGIVSGCQASPLLYCPAINTDRQAMAKFICLGLESANPGSCTTTSCTDIFTDVTSGNPFCPFIEALYYAGVVNGCSASPLMYCPNTMVTREQMAKFLVNGFGFML
ncbi:MAG: hypothetical protein A2Y62_19670 [Candidatus Fischerbacteria bacterium RBG_13_37_8]|uniref:SLH domain-containing protein n=1 Tax=Candidatus Fischerbacteria bacterium RBG_13_37_8 TaxID=1817863 RepID=A0A1F5VX80_9BACT|nr:MAG: hypothetical protein A2Y62_19670 [Candidatus Fischerbacteria bacterium RBG_13_37_8]